MLIPAAFVLQLFACAAIIAYGAFNPAWLKVFLSKSSYYIILALTLTWGFVLSGACRRWCGTPAAFWGKHWKALLLTLVAAGSIFLSVPKDHRVLSDETNLLSVSRSMTFYKNVDNVTEGRWYYERFWPTKSTAEKRPYLFPFFTQLLHLVLGYKAGNVFILNFFALWGLLFSLYLLLKPYAGMGGAFIGIILALSQPLVCLSATSGNFEVFNVLFVALSFLSMRWFLASRSPESFSVLVFNLLMLANIRYESILFLCVIMAFLWLKGYLKRGVFFSVPIVLSAPVFLVPLAAQRMVMLTVNQNGASGRAWMPDLSFGYVAKNTASFFRYVFDIPGSLGYAGLTSWLGGAALVFFIIRSLARKKEAGEEPHSRLFQACLLSLAALFPVLAAHVAGINDHPLNGRYYLPILVFLSVMPALVIPRKHLVLGLLLSGAMFAYYHPVAMEDKIDNNLLILREYKFVSSFLEQNADKNALVVCGRPGQYVVDNRGAVSFSTANREKGSILAGYRNHLFSQVFVVQPVSYATGKPLDGNLLDPEYRLEPVAKMQVATYYLQISRVIPQQ